MPISAKTRQMLWGRAAGLCAFPQCRLHLVVDSTETDDETLIGEACHIVAESLDGPRGQSPLTAEQRDKYGNLILLCRNHHRQIDTQIETYPVERLQQLKLDHESWVRSSLPGYDAAKQRDDEIYAGYVDDWASKVDLDNWRAWSSNVLSHGQPSMRLDQDEALWEARRWLLSRIWPQRYSSLEGALRNFLSVLNDFQVLFRQHATEKGKILRTDRFYKTPNWDEEEYRRLLREYEFHVALVEDLMLELTRAANLVCDEVRATIQPSYRMKEGHLLVEYGPVLNDLSFITSLTLYREDDKATGLYPGLEKFKKVRFKRDKWFGEK
jgi:HNH endonuclease